MNLKKKVMESLKWKKGDHESARRLGIPLRQYRELKAEVKSEKRKPPANKIKEFRENLSDGTANIKAVALSEPRTPDEIIEVLQLDTSKWKLSSYWHREQNGYWLVSANVTRKKDSELSPEDVSEVLSTVFRDKSFKPFKPSLTRSNQKGLFIYTSDKHIAAHVEGTAIYANPYNGRTFESRMKEILYEVQYLVSVFGKFEDIYIIDLGDRMDGMGGFTTRGGHKLPQNMNDKEAFTTALMVEKEFLDLIIQQEHANHYHVLQNANSNHGGVMDYMVSKALELYLNTKYPEVETRIMEKFIEHVSYGIHTILLTHGKDTEDLKHGLPMHLNDKTENYINKYMMHHGIDHKTSRVSLVKGDLHVNNSQEAYGFRYRNVMSLFGGSKWVGHNFGPNIPGCSMDIIEKGTDRIYEHRLTFQTLEV